MINLVTNEKLFSDCGFSHCNNIEIKNLTDELDKIQKTQLIGRISHIQKYHKIQNKNILKKKNLLSYLICIYKETLKKDSLFLIVSITPYTFFSILLLKLLKKKFLIYLRSDGFVEYKKILGFFGILIYKVMFYLSTKNSKIISPSKDIMREINGEIITPSSLSSKWSQNTKPSSFKKIKILYVGRARVEKGIFSLISIFEKLKSDIKLTIVGNDGKKLKISHDHRVEIKEIIHDENELIKYYDDCSIFILPSFTESYSMVIDEALIRLRPVIIFKEIENIIGKRKGIFISERNHKDLLSKINYIATNYENILRDIKNNKFTNKQDFAREVIDKLKKN